MMVVVVMKVLENIYWMLTMCQILSTSKNLLNPPNDPGHPISLLRKQRQRATKSSFLEPHKEWEADVGFEHKQFNSRVHAPINDVQGKY